MKSTPTQYFLFAVRDKHPMQECSRTLDAADNIIAQTAKEAISYYFFYNKTANAKYLVAEQICEVDYIPKLPTGYQA